MGVCVPSSEIPTRKNPKFICITLWSRNRNTTRADSSHGNPHGKQEGSFLRKHGTRIWIHINTMNTSDRGIQKQNFILCLYIFVRMKTDQKRGHMHVSGRKCFRARTMINRTSSRSK